MSYHMSVEDLGQYLRVSVTGECSPENVANYLAEVHARCLERQCASVLVEENLQGPSLEIVDIFEIVTHASRNAWPAIQRVAYVDINPEHTKQSMQFAEIVATIRGVNAKVFSATADAEAWLKAEIRKTQRAQNAVS